MVIDEIFPHPTVKQVIFQIRYPNLFYIENRIGDLQLKIMKMFPNSSLLQKQQIVFTEVGPDGNIDVPKGSNEDMARKIWQFESEKGFKLNITSDSLTIVSDYHKTYNIDQDGIEKFRDVIEVVLNSFHEIMMVPIINRIGFRYIDECPLPSKDNDTFKEYYNSVFPIDRFNLEYVTEMDFKTVFKIDDYRLRYIESLQKSENKYNLILDFDGFTNNIDFEDYLEVTDKLHEIILDEYEKTIKDKVKQHMKREEE